MLFEKVCLNVKLIAMFGGAHSPNIITGRLLWCFVHSVISRRWSLRRCFSAPGQSSTACHSGRRMNWSGELDSSNHLSPFRLAQTSSPLFRPLQLLYRLGIYFLMAAFSPMVLFSSLTVLTRWKQELSTSMTLLII